jgi:serine/threonine protein kinase
MVNYCSSDNANFCDPNFCNSQFVAPNGSLMIPSSWTEVQGGAFRHCTALRSVTFAHSSVSTVGAYAFSRCVALESVTFAHSSVSTVERYAFSRCSALRSVIYANNSHEIDFTGSSHFDNHGCANAGNFDISDFYGNRVVNNIPSNRPAANGVCNCAPLAVNATCNLEFGLNAAGVLHQQTMQDYVDATYDRNSSGRVFTTGDTEIVPGFNLADNVSLSNLFSNLRDGSDGNPLLRFAVVSDYASNSSSGTQAGVSLGDDLFVSPSSGKMSLKMDYPGNHTVSLVAYTGSGPEALTRPATVLRWTVRVREPGVFSLRNDTEGCGEQYVRTTLQDQIAEELRRIAPNNNRHDLNTTVIVPGINTNICDFSQIFEHAAGPADQPEISFRVAVENAATNAPDYLGDEPFFTDTGRLSLNLKREGSFRVTLQAFTIRRDGRHELNLTDIVLDIQLPDTHDAGTREIRNCSGHGTVAEDEDEDGIPVRQNDVHRCICNGLWTGDDCESEVTLPELNNIDIAFGNSSLSYMNYSVSATLPLQLSVARAKWAVGTTYQLPPLVVTADGVNSSVISIEFDQYPAGFFLNGDTGEIIGVPDVVRPATQVIMYATTPGHTRSVLGTFAFEYRHEDSDDHSAAVGPNGSSCDNGGIRTDGPADGETEFDDVYSCDCAGTGYTGENCQIEVSLPPLRITDIVPDTSSPGYVTYAVSDDAVPQLSMSRSKWAVDNTYRLPPINVTADGVDSSAIGIEFSEYPPGFFMNGDTGETIGVPNAVRAPLTVAMYATAPGHAKAVLGRFTFEYRSLDKKNDSAVVAASNVTGCENNGTVTDGPEDSTTEFDGFITCVCTPGYEGPNCGEYIEPPPAAGASSSDGNTALIGGSLGAVLFVMLAALIANRFQVYRLKHTPIDVEGMQAEVMQSLGLVATTNIGPQEFGVTLILDESPGEVTEQCKAALVATLRKAVPLLKPALVDAKITAAASGASKHILVVMQKDATKAASIAEIAVEQLLRKASKTRLAVGDRTIVDANVAVPQRVPREISRSALTRIGVLGEGAFGEVHQYQMEERGSSMAFFVAAKSIKAGAAGAEEARADLLKEAAVGALLVHRNIVASVGICTTPRDVPALLLLAFYPEGDLAGLCAEATVESTTVSERLTYCAQVLQGLQFISTRRIIHRDVAARNVLLDATMTCKISDFGMASALQEGGKEYIRSTEQLAIRWCSIEVIQEGKYSTQSDVWAFGVLAYEVFSCGTLPYSDQFDNLTEVSNFIKEGGQLDQPNPEACPLEVYTALMLPCFSADPAERPAFGALYDVAVAHGAEEDDVALAERAARRKAREDERQAAAAADADPGDRSLLGPSVHHLETTLVPAVQAAVEAIKRNKGHANQSSFDDLDPAEASIWHTVHSYAKPASADTVCPRDGEMGCGYVDTLASPDDVGQSDALLSYSWGYLVAEVSAALSAWTERTERHPKRTYIWICSLCLNQHRLGGGDAATPEDLAKEFGERVVAFGRILP